MSSFVFHSSLLTVKGVDLVIHLMASFALWKSSVFCIVATLITEVLFKMFILLCNGLSLTDNEVKCFSADN